MGSSQQTPSHSLEGAGSCSPPAAPSQGTDRNSAGWKCFYYSFGQTGRDWGPALGAAEKLSSPYPAPSPGSATPEPEREDRASEPGKPCLGRPQAWTGWREGWAVNSSIVQIYSAGRGGRSTPPASSDRDAAHGAGLCNLGGSEDRPGSLIRGGPAAVPGSAELGGAGDPLPGRMDGEPRG